MRVTITTLAGVLLIEPDVHEDERGYFLETWHAERYAAAGLPPFVQDNLAWSHKGVLRGLHFQEPNPQGKLVTVPRGAVYDVAVNVDPMSPDYGRWVGFLLSGVNHRQLYIPPGFAHGYAVASETAIFTYKCTAPYDPTAERGIAWNDPDVGINWPITDPILSLKDAALPRLRDLCGAPSGT